MRPGSPQSLLISAVNVLAGVPWNLIKCRASAANLSPHYELPSVDMTHDSSPLNWTGVPGSVAFSANRHILLFENGVMTNVLCVLTHSVKVNQNHTDHIICLKNMLINVSSGDSLLVTSSLVLKTFKISHPYSHELIMYVSIACPWSIK